MVVYIRAHTRIYTKTNWRKHHHHQYHICNNNNNRRLVPIKIMDFVLGPSHGQLTVFFITQHSQFPAILNNIWPKKKKKIILASSHTIPTMSYMMYFAYAKIIPMWHKTSESVGCRTKSKINFEYSISQCRHRIAPDYYYIVSIHILHLSLGRMRPGNHSARGHLTLRLNISNSNVLSSFWGDSDLLICILVGTLAHMKYEIWINVDSKMKLSN